jgi:hypothetical protein
MKNIIYLFTLLILLFSGTAKASHVVGYDMTMISLGNDLYKFRLVGYRDVTGATLANSYNFGVYKNSDNAAAPVASVVVNKISQVSITYNPKDCPPAGADLRLEKWTFESAAINFSAFNAVDGYYVSSSECCRNPGISNVLNSASTGITFTMEFPRLNSTSPMRFNSSPDFRKAPLTYFSVGKLYTLDWSVVDPNGDSLVYKMAQSRNVGTLTKPFTKIEFAPGYKLDSNIADGAPDFNINIQTGIITYKPNNIGRYLIAIKVEEWKRVSGSTAAYKIGEITREFQIENVYSPETPPVTTDELNQKRVIVDTVYYNSTYNKVFTSRDSPSDSLYMMIIPDITAGENVLDPVKFGGKWGEAGSVLGNSSNLILEDLSQVKGEFKWKPSCAVVRTKPYTFRILVRDKTCPVPFYDTTDVFIYVTKKPNNKPTFVSPDTITSNTIKNYYINAGDKFQLAGDSIIKTYDMDSLGNVVSIFMEPYQSNGAAVNSKFVFSSNPNVIHSTATFSWQTDYKDGRVEPYKIKFIAEDDDCSKHDSITFEINIFVAGQSFCATPINGASVVVDTSLIYTYTTSNTIGVNYFWHGKNLTIISGQGTDSVKVKWNNIGTNQIVCVFSSTQINCIDSSFLIINPSYQFPSAGLTGYWLLNGNGIDISGRGNNGTVSSALPNPDRNGNLNRALKFSKAQNSFVKTKFNLKQYPNTFSYSFWANPDSLINLPVEGETSSGIEGIVPFQVVIHPNHGACYGSESTNAGTGLCVGKNGIVVIEHSHNFVKASLVCQANISGWHNIVLIYNNKIPSIYIDGVFIKTGLSDTRNVHASYGFDDNNFGNYSNSGFGAGFNGPNNDGRFYSGQLDDIGIWNRALTQSEITAIYNSMPTGINNIKNFNIKIYPNPTNNIINIEGLTKNENNTIQIFDVQGKLVITKTITEKGTIDLSELNKGVYVIKIGEVAQRIVKM